MNPERFLALLDAYGADMRRWPDAERAAARALAAQGSPELRQRMSEAALLDGWLDKHTVAAPDDALMRRVAAGAAAAGPASATSGGAGWRLRWLWPGAGLAGIGLAGTLAGAFVVSVALRGANPPDADWPDRSTAFSGLSADWSEE